MNIEVIALLKCGIEDANDAGTVMQVDPSWMRHTCQLALDEIERLQGEIERITKRAREAASLLAHTDIAATSSMPVGTWRMRREAFFMPSFPSEPQTDATAAPSND